MSVNDRNQIKGQYKPDPRVSLIIKSSPNDTANNNEKERFNKLIRETALGLFRNFKAEKKL